MVSIKIHFCRDMVSGHDVCDIFDCNTGTWFICDDDIITNHSGYQENVYNDLSHKK